MIQEFTETMLNNVLKELIYVWKKEIYFYEQAENPQNEKGETDINISTTGDNE